MIMSKMCLLWTEGAVLGGPRNKNGENEDNINISDVSKYTFKYIIFAKTKNTNISYYYCVLLYFYLKKVAQLTNYILNFVPDDMNSFTVMY